MGKTLAQQTPRLYAWSARITSRQIRDQPTMTSQTPDENGHRPALRALVQFGATRWPAMKPEDLYRISRFTDLPSDTVNNTLLVESLQHLVSASQDLLKEHKDNPQVGEERAMQCITLIMLARDALDECGVYTGDYNDFFPPHPAR
jgi:hypothetical protein